MTRTFFALFVLVIGCGKTTSDVRDSSGSSIAEDDGSGDGDADTGEDDGDEDDGWDDPDVDYTWTEGPEPAPCEPIVGDSTSIALSGVLLTVDGPENGDVVYDSSTGLIECAGSACDLTNVTRVCTEGIISAGLIDSHNHMQYNAIGPWDHGKLFTDRYDWQGDDDYDDFRTAYDAIKDPFKCEIMKWAELRSLVGGSTSVVGSSGGGCIDPLIRNLEEGNAASGLGDYRLSYSSGKVRNSYEEGDIKIVGVDGDAIVNHVAEGIGGSVTAEIAHMLEIGMSGPGQVYVHATDATTEQLAAMADDRTAIAWSPRSNLDLYAATTPADVAYRLGVPISLAPDWTWSGSMSPAHELSCANEWLYTRSSDISDITMWSWTTTEAARVLNLDGLLGDLSAGLKADITVFSWSNEPYRTVIEGDPRNVELVLVDGHALYGQSDWISALAENPDWCEPIDACGIARHICVQSGDSGDDAQTASEIENILGEALAPINMPDGLDYAKELFDLFLCEDTRNSCNFAQPSAEDGDGDEVIDASDVCPDAYDPLQRDHDGDGIGDACDPCPLAADRNECSHAPGDIDGDGKPTSSDNCPWLYNQAQADMDGDGIGDACDICPEEASDSGACTFSIPEIRDPASARRVPEGTLVKIDDVVVTGIRSTVGFYVQDPTADRYAGIFVYDRGDFSSETGLSVGVQISITGVYEDYNGLDELTDVEVLTEAEGSIPDPVAVSDPCAIATDGSLENVYESMLVAINDVTVTNANPDAPSDYGEFEVGGCLRFDDQLTDALIPQPAVGTSFSALSGILTHTYGHSKVEPRGPEDIEE